MQLKISNGNKTKNELLFSPLLGGKVDVQEFTQLDDGQLIALVRKNSSFACAELHLRYQKKLFTYIFHLVGNRDETEDILQAVFLKTFKNIEYFDTTRKFSSWIYRIAHNESVNFLKRKSKRYTVSWDEVVTSKDKLETAANDESYEDKWMQEEISREIKQAMEKLPEKYQRALHLRYFKEHSYEDISKILGKPVNTVGTLINRAKRKLLEVVQQQEQPIDFKLP